MIEVISANHLGLFDSSLGLRGMNGTGASGRFGERAFVNSNTGNLVIRAQDEALAALGADFAVVRTYNSRGQLVDDNGDNWQLNVAALIGIPGAANAGGSSVTKRFGDGAEIRYDFDTVQGLYVATAGTGAHDTMSYSAATGQWTWTGGDSAATETYNSAGRQIAARDADGNTIGYAYTGALLTSITDASGQSVFFDYAGANLTQVRVVSQGISQTLTRYAYDASNRLTQVTVDLSPEDGSVADGRTYVTTYTYDGASKRVASISRSDGGSESFTYDAQGRVASYTDGAGKITALSYTSGGTTTASANSAVLATTETQTTSQTYSLNAGLLSTTDTQTTSATYNLNAAAAPFNWSGAGLLESSAAAAFDPKIGFDQNGNGVALWRESNNLLVRHYNKAANTWGSTLTLDSNANAISAPNLYVDVSGNAAATWLQSDGVATRVWVSRYIASTQSWSLDSFGTAGVLSLPKAVINGSGQAYAVWKQGSNTIVDVRFIDGVWQPQESYTSNAIPDFNLAIDAQGVMRTIWCETFSGFFYVVTDYYTPGIGWGPATDLVNTPQSAANPALGFDQAGNGIALWSASGNVQVSRYIAATATWTAPTTLDTGPGAIGTAKLAVSASGNAIVTWVQSDATANSIWVSRYNAATQTWSAAQTIEASAAVAADPATAINANGEAVVVWRQAATGTTTPINLYANRFKDGAWQGAELLESNANTITLPPAVTMDASGNVQSLWQQSDGTATSIYTSRLQKAYVIQSGNTWASIAAALYGSADVANELQTALGNPPLTAGNQILLASLPATLTHTVTTTITVPPYYTIPSGATWASLAATLYGSASVAAELQAAMGNPPLTAGNRLTNLPASLTHTVTTVTTVPAYYTVQAADTWASITQTVYGTSDANAVSALQAATGNPALTAGLHLTVPLTLTYLPTSAVAQTDITDPLGFVTTYVSDSQGRLIQILSPAMGGTRLATSYAYDAQGNLVQITDANGNAVVMQYDARGNLLSKRDGLGDTAAYAYNSANLLVAETHYLIPDPDGSGAAQPGAPVTSRYVYDGERHLRFTVSAEGRVTEHRYDAAGNRVTAIAYTGAVYDIAGLAPADTLSESQLSAWAGAQDLTRTERTDYAYDFRGNVSAATAYGAIGADGAGIAGTQSTTSFVYDQRGRLLQTIDPRGAASPADPNDYATTYTYDGLGRVLSATQWVSATQTRTTLTAYDDAHKQVVTTLANGLVATQVYDARGLLVSASQANGAQALGTTVNQYDADGQLRITTDPLGNKSHFLYDAAGRNVATVDATGAMSENVYDGDAQVIRQIGYANRLSAAQLASLVDASGNPANVALASVRPAADAANDRVVRRVYDAANRLVMVITPADTDATQGFVTQSFYDGAGRVVDVVGYATAIALTALPAAPTPAQVSALVASSSADRHSRAFYDNEGRLVAELKEEGYFCEYQYNAAGELVHTVHHANAVSAGLRASGTLAQLRNDVGTSAGDQHGYSFYNGKGQVVALLDPEGYLSELGYDAAGNQTQAVRYYSKAAAYTGTQTIAQLRPAASANDAVTLSTYNGANQLVTLTTNPSGTTTRYVYDSTGHLIQTDKAWNSSDVRTTQARYDAQGRVLQEMTGEGSRALNELLASNPSATQAEIDAVWNQYSLTHAYDVDGRRTATTDQNGNKALFYYDAENRLTLTVNALGEVTEIRYNAFGQATESIRYTARISTAGLTGGAVTAGLATALAAIASSADSHSTTNYTLRGAVKSALDALGNLASYTYNAFGELASRLDPIGGGADTRTTYSYDRRGLLTQKIEDADNGAYVGIKRTLGYTYDAFGRLIGSTDGNGNARSYAYDRLGRTITTSDPSGSRNQTYDAHSRVLAQTDALGHTTTYSYDDAAGSLTLTTAAGITTTTTANRHGQTLTLTDGNGNTSSYAYDKDGRLTSANDALNNSASSEYDRAGRLIETTDARGIVTQFGYDAANRVLTRTFDPAGLNLQTSYAYDGQGRKISVTDPRGTLTQIAYDAKGQVLTSALDPAGLNLRSAYSYDAQGRVLTLTEGAGTAAARTTQYVYDRLGRRTETHVDPAGLNLTTTYVYDKNGNVVAATEAAGTSIARTTRYVYDGVDRLIYVVNALGAVTKSDYDAGNNLVAVTRYANAISLAGLGNAVTAATVQSRLAPDAARDPLTRYAYDGDNRMVFCVDAMQNLCEKEYDAVGHVVRETRYAHALPATVAVTVAAIGAQLATLADPALDQTTRTVYDAAGRAVYSIDALDYVTQSVYDAGGNVVRSVRYAEAIVLPATLDATGVAAALAPSSADRATRSVYDSANRAVYTIDPAGYVKQTRYDGAGNIIETVSYANLPALAPAPSAAQVQTALAAVLDAARDQHTLRQYDRANRVTGTTDALGNSASCTYDAVGNKLTCTNEKGAVWTYAYDKAGQILTETAPQVAVTRLTQNANGSVTPVTTTEAIVTSFIYDAFGNVRTRTEAAGSADARTITYAYDALGRQIQTINPQASVYNAAADQASNYIGRNETAVTPTSTTYYDALGNAAAGRDVDGNFSYKLYDRLGRVTYEVDAERYVTGYTYDAFGNQLTLARNAAALAESIFTSREAQAGATAIQALTLADISGPPPAPSVMWTQDFTSGASGLTGDGLANPSFMQVTGGRLQTRTQNVATTTYPYLRGANNYSASQQTLFHSEVTTTSSSGRFLTIGAENSGALANNAYRCMAAYFDGTSLYAYYQDASQFAQSVYLGEVLNNTTYNVDVRVDNNGSTLYVYRAGQSAADGMSYAKLDTTWGDAHTVLWTIGYSGEVANTTFVDNLRETTGTPPPASSWTQDFAVNAQGLTGDGLSNPAYMQVTGGRLMTRTQNAASTVFPLMASLHAYSASQAPLFHFEVTTTTSAGRYLEAGAQNSGDSTAGTYRALTALIENGDLYASYYDASDAADPWKYVWLGAIADNTTYNVDVQIDANGAALYVYQVGQIPSGGFTFKRSDTGWGDVYASVWTMGAPGQVSSVTYIDNVTETTGMNAPAPAWLQDFSTNASGFGGDGMDDPAYMQVTGGRLMTRTVNAPEEVFPGMRGLHDYSAAQATLFHYEVTTTTSSGRYFMIGTENSGDIPANTFRRMAVLFEEGSLYAHYYDAEDLADPWKYVWLGALQDNTTYNIDLRVDTGGTTLTVYRAGQSPASGFSFNRADASWGDAHSSMWTMGTPGQISSTTYLDNVRETPQSQSLLDRTVTKVYDKRNQLVETRAPAVSNLDSSAAPEFQSFSASPTVHTTFDAFGEAVKTSSLKNALTDTWTDTYFYYDARGRKVAQVDALGYVSAYQYDANGNLTQETQYARALSSGSWSSAGFGAPTATTAGSAAAVSAIGFDRVTRYGYDRLNRKTSQTQVGVQYAAATYAGTAAVTAVLGDLATSYAYDALGNLTTVTDATGASTYSYYDALGRITAIAAPARPGPGGATLIPLTTMQRDVFGNVVRQTVLANGAASASAAAFTAGAANAQNDQASYTVYDNYGRALRAIDAQGISTYSSYDAMGNVMKQWRALTNPDGQTSQPATLFGYDRLGHQVLTSNVIAGTNPAVVRHQVHYDAFGEIDRKGVNDGWQEYFDYDAAGRLWQTNQDDGLNKVMYYNLQGQATSQSVSAQRLSALPTAMPSYMRVTGGRLVTQTHNAGTEVFPSLGGTRSYSTAQTTLFHSEVTTTVALGRYLVIGAENGGDADANTYRRMAAFFFQDMLYAAYYDESNPADPWQSVALGTIQDNITYSVDVQVNALGATLWVYQTGQDPASGFTYTRTGSTWGDAHSAIWTEGNPGQLPAITYVDNMRETSGGVLAWSQDFSTDASGLTGDGLFAAVVQGMEQRTDTIYDDDGRALRQIQPSFTQNDIVITPAITQTLDRWGNVLTVTDPRNGAWLTEYRYDYLNHRIEQKSPQVDIWLASGANAPGRPTLATQYDARGLELSTVDANGNRSTKRYDAAGNLIGEYHADGGVVSHAFDALGREVACTDANGNVTTYAYDRKNQLLTQQLAIAAERYTYTYDEAGNRVTAANGAGETTRYFYDALGNLLATRNPMGGTNPGTTDRTVASYDVFGHKISENNAAGDTATWTYDYFGKLLEHTDLGGHLTRYTYDSLGLLATQTSTLGQSLTYSYYENSRLKEIVDNTLQTDTLYEYDAAGHQTRSRFASLASGAVYQDTRTTYDAAGRLVDVSDPNAHIQYFYDANGNRRRGLAQYLDASGASQTQDNWYAYDGMNRMTVSQGVLQGGQIIIGSQGTQLGYDATGNRRTATTSSLATTYNYDAENRLTTTSDSAGQATSRTYDAAGRVTQLVTTQAGQATKVKNSSFNADGIMTAQTDLAGGLTVDTIQYTTDGVGNILQYVVNQYSSGNFSYTITYTDTYQKLDTYKVSSVVGVSSAVIPGNVTITFDANGNQVTFTDSGNAHNNYSLVTNAAGQFLQKTQSAADHGGGAAGLQRYFYAGNDPVGTSGNMSPANFDYNFTPVSDQYPALTPGKYVVNNGDTLRSIALAVYGDAGLWFLVADANGLQSDADLRVGQTLTIPNKVSNLHNSADTHKVYNPGQIIGDTTPTAKSLPPPPPPPPPSRGGCGSVLRIIAVVVVAVIATVLTAGIAATVFAPAATATLGVFSAGTAALTGSLGVAGVAAAAIGGAAGSIASQFVGIGLGVQQKFSWGAVAVGALGAAATSGIGAAFGSGGVSGALGFGNGSIAGGAIDGIVGNVTNQGIKILVGQQKSFDWTGAAVAGIFGGITSGEAGKSLGLSQSPAPGQALDPVYILQQTGIGILRGAVTQALDNHGKVEWLSVAADAFGNALANSLVMALRDPERPPSQGASRLTPPEEERPAGPTDAEREALQAQARDEAARAAAARQADFERRVSDNIDYEEAEAGERIRQADFERQVSQNIEQEQADLGAAFREMERQREIDRIWASVDMQAAMAQAATATYAAPGIYVTGDPAPARRPLESYGMMEVFGFTGDRPDVPPTDFERRLGGAVAGTATTLWHTGYGLAQLGSDTVYQNINTLFGGLPREYLPYFFQGPHERWSARADALVGLVTTSPVETGSRIWGNISTQWNMSWEYEAAGDFYNAERLRFGLYAEGALLVAPFGGPLVRGVGRLSELQFPIAFGTNGLASGLGTVGMWRWVGFGAAETFATTEAVTITGSRTWQRALSYEREVVALYGAGEVVRNEQAFWLLTNGAWAGPRYADRIVSIEGMSTAIEAKFTNAFAYSPYNPFSGAPHAVQVYGGAIAQAQRYQAAFPGGMIYHTNSLELAQFYSGAFRHNGVTNFQFVITPATRAAR